MAYNNNHSTCGGADMHAPYVEQNEQNKMNIAEILKSKPKDTVLYSVLHGKVLFKDVKHEGTIVTLDPYGRNYAFRENGHGYTDFNGDGECILFPSREMRDWEKFQWKHGDVLIGENGDMITFTEWSNDNYTLFNGAYHACYGGEVFCRKGVKLKTGRFSKASAEQCKPYMIAIENEHGGKLNFEALEHEPKPFDRVLTRDDDDDEWQANIFSHSSTEYPYLFVTIRDKWKQCIPYEGNEHLLGTTDKP